MRLARAARGSPFVFGAVLVAPPPPGLPHQGGGEGSSVCLRWYPCTAHTSPLMGRLGGGGAGNYGAPRRPTAPASATSSQPTISPPPPSGAASGNSAPPSSERAARSPANSTSPSSS